VNRAYGVCAGGVGVAFGFFLTASGLGDYRTIHRGLLLEDAYIYLMMAATVAVGAGGVSLVRRRARTVFGGALVLPRHPVRRRTVLGAAVFGVGFGVGATCPGITVAMVATGGLYGAVVLLGIFGGLWLRGWVEESRARTMEGTADEPAGRSRRALRVLAEESPGSTGQGGR
jgi:uncharacterized membrane protein YedE/YeeE